MLEGEMLPDRKRGVQRPLSVSYSKLCLSRDPSVCYDDT